MARVTATYTKTAKLLHWGIALIIIGMLASGLLMDDLAMPLKFQVIQMHKSFGLLVLLLVFVRALWKFTNPAPRLPAAMPAWQKLAAEGTHLLLYVLMFGMPLVGWLMSDAKGYHPSLFGLPVPLLGHVDKPMGHVLAEMHEVGGYVFLVLLTLHVAAALYHHLVVKDDVLLRMLPACHKRRASLRGMGLLVAGLSLLAAPVFAATSWVVVPAASSLEWAATFNGQTVKGVFKQWTADIAFDAADLAHSHVHVEVPLASVDSGDDERDGTLKGPDFFNVATTPVAVFDSREIRKAPHGYEAVGTLTMAGVKQPVVLPFEVTITGTTAEAHGVLPLSRKVSGIGKGQWQDAGEIGDRVDVTFRVTAHAGAR